MKFTKNKTPTEAVGFSYTHIQKGFNILWKETRKL